MNFASRSSRVLREPHASPLLSLDHKAQHIEQTVHVAILFEFLERKVKREFSSLRITQTFQPNLIVRDGTTFLNGIH